MSITNPSYKTVKLYTFKVLAWFGHDRLMIEDLWDQSVGTLDEHGHLLDAFQETPFGQLMLSARNQLERDVNEGRVSNQADSRGRDIFYDYDRMISAVGMIMGFERYNRKVIHPSVGLTKMMLAMTSSLPLREICIPYPCCFVYLKEYGFQLPESPGKLGTVEGVYVGRDETALEERVKSQYGPTAMASDYAGIYLGVSLIVDRHLESEIPVFYYAYRKDSDATIEDYKQCHAPAWKTFQKAGLSESEATEKTKHIQRMFPLCFNVFAYMSSAEGKQDMTVSRSKLFQRLRAARNPLEEAQLKAAIALAAPAEITVVGKRITIPAGTKDLPELSDEESARSVKTHWRRGHWRRVWIGAHDSAERHLEPRLIAAVLVNPGETSVAEKVVYNVVR